MQQWKIKLSLYLNFFVFAILLNSVGIVILQVINNYQVTNIEASILEACKDLSIAVCSFLIASFIPRIGYKKSMLIGLMIVMLACLAMPLLNSFMMTKVLFICIGISFALIKVSVYATVGVITKTPQEHAGFFSTIEGVFQIGVLSGYWIFGLFLGSKTYTWLDTYWVLALLTTIAFILLLTTQLDEHQAQKNNISILDDFLNMLKLVKLPLVLLFICSIFLYVFIEQGIQSWLPTFNNKVLFLPESISVQITSIFAISIAIGRIFGGFIMKKLLWLYVIIAALICAAVLVVIVLPLAQGVISSSIKGWSSVPLAGYIFPLIGFFLAPIYPTLCSTVLSKLPKHNQSAMAGLIVVFSALGGTIGSRIVSILFATFGGEKAFYCTLIPIGLLILLMLPYYKLHSKFILKSN